MKGKGSYTGTVTAEFTIKAPATTLAGAAVKLSKTSYAYNGKARRPTVTVTLNGVKLKRNTDYTLKYADNINVGTATVTIKGKGDYTGSIVETFVITNP